MGFGADYSDRCRRANFVQQADRLRPGESRDESLSANTHPATVHDSLDAMPCSINDVDDTDLIVAGGSRTQSAPDWMFRCKLERCCQGKALVARQSAERSRFDQRKPAVCERPRLVEHEVARVRESLQRVAASDEYPAAREAAGGRRDCGGESRATARMDR